MKVSPATQAWAVWRERRTLHRRQLSWGLSVLSPVLLVLGFWLAGSFHLLNFGDDGRAIAVKLGNPDGEQSPLSVTAMPDPVMAFVQQQTATQAALLEDLPDPQAIPVKKEPAAKPTPAPAEKTPVAKPVAETKPADKPAAPTTVVKGAENGNTAQAVFEGTLKGIRENLHPLISLFMPLPKVLDANLLDRLQGDSLNTAEDFRKMLLALYEPSGNTLRLKGQPPIVGRDYYWVVLLKAGYDATKADYKAGRNLSPVTLSFKLTTAASGEIPRLTEIKLEKSSGDAEIDSIVRTVFEQYRYSNPTGDTVAGRFTYEF